MIKRLALALLAFLCLGMVAAVQAESTQHMRLRLHKLVEDYVAVHEMNQVPNHKILNFTKMCPGGKIVMRHQDC